MPPALQPRPAAAWRRAASTSAANSAAARARAASVSACHCTPSRNARAGASIASITPSGAHATARSPPPSLSTAWWWKELTRTPPAPHHPLQQAARRDLDASGSPRRPGPPGGARASSPGRSGRCWCSVPPRATFSACSPRQIGEDRQAARVGAAGQLELEDVELGLGRPELGMAALVVGGRVEVGPA